MTAAVAFSIGFLIGGIGMYLYIAWQTHHALQTLTDLSARELRLYERAAEHHKQVDDL